MTQSNDLNVIGVLREVYTARLFLLLGLFIGVLAGFAFVVAAKPRVEARMMIGPAQPMDASMQARFEDGRNSYILGAEGAARNNGGGEAISNFTRFEAMMRGVSVSRLLLRDDRVVDGLAGDAAFVFEDARGVMQPSELSAYIGKRVTLDRFGESPLKEMVYQHHDGAFAAYFVQQIHRISDQLIRAELRGQVDERIAYLERVIAKTNNPEQRRIVTNLLLEQERARMMVSMDAPVAASVIEPVSAGVRVVWPNAALVYCGFGALGLLIGYLVFGVVYYEEETAVAAAPKRGLDMRGDDLRHEPRRPLKYGSWFRGAPDNDTDDDIARPAKRAKDAGDAAE